MKRRIKPKSPQPEKIVKIANVVMVLLLIIILLISYLAYQEEAGYLFIIWAPLSGYIAVFYLYLVNVLKQQNKELNEQNKSLVLANQKKSEFVYNCAHQLRTPLTTIKGAIDLLLDGSLGTITSPQERFLFNVDRSLQQLNGLVCNLLDHSMMTSGRQELDIKLTNIQKLVDDVTTFLKPAAVEKNITLESNIPKDISDIPTDSERLRQVLINLIDYAIKFTEKTGKVNIQAKEWSDCIQMAVVTTGKRLSQEEYEHIFDEFYKTTLSYEGQELGLAMAKGIIEAHGGEIWAEAGPKGSVFYFILPKETKALTLLKERRQISKFLTPSLTLIDYVNQNTLQKIQDNFTEAIGISVSILDTDGNPITKSVGLNRFCSLIQSCAEGKRRCKQFSVRIKNDSLRDNKPKAYYCFAGLAHFVAPIIVENVPMGSIELEGAQIFTPIDHRKIQNIATELGLDRDALMEAASDIKKFPEDKIYASGELLHSIAKTISSLCTQEHELTHKIAELSTLSHIGRAITSTLDLDKLLDLILYTTITVLEGDSGSIMFIDKEHDELYVKVGYGMTKEVIRGKRIKIGRDIAGYVAKENKALRIDRGMEDNPHFVRILHKEGLKSVMSIPLVLKNEVVGVFNINRIKGSNFTDEDLNVFSALALQSTIVIEEAHLYQALEHKASELTTFSKIGKTILSTLGIEQVLNLIVESVSEVMQTKQCVLRLVDKKEGKLTLQESIGLKKKDLVIEEKFAIRACEQKTPIVCPDVKKEESQTTELEISSLLTVPLVVRERVIGTISILSTKPHSYSEQEIELLSTFADQSSIAIENAGLFEAIRKGFIEATASLSQAIDLKDAYIGGHSEEKARYAYEIAKELGMPEVAAENVKMAALLHDVGKIGIPEEILLKPGGLTDEEFELVKKHPLISTDILKSIAFPKEVICAIRHHHERLDGKGYPDGLTKDEIAQEALIIEAVDVYGAMTKDRPYRKALSKEDAITELKKGAGTQFAPEIVDAFIKVLKRS